MRKALVVVGLAGILLVVWSGWLAGDGIPVPRKNMGADSGSPLSIYPDSVLAVYFDPYISELEVSQMISDFNCGVIESTYLYEYSYLHKFYYLRILDTTSVLAVVDSFNQDSRVAAVPDIEFVDFAVYPDDPQFEDQWHLINTRQDGWGWPTRDINAPGMWNIRTDCDTVRLAIWDTGIEYYHADLGSWPAPSNIWLKAAEDANANGIPEPGVAFPAGDDNLIDGDGDGYMDDVVGWDFAGPDNDPDDFDGHGTNVAGMAGAIGDNTNQICGTAWSTTMIPIAKGRAGTMAPAARYAVNNGAKVINASWGYVGAQLNAIRPGLDVRMARFGRALVNWLDAKGVVLVVAAGNVPPVPGQNIDVAANYVVPFQSLRAIFPGVAFDNLLVVAATDNRDDLPMWSCFGAECVDLAAPGEDVLTTGLMGTTEETGGTSFAAPQVAAVAAMLFAENPGWTPADVRDAIISNVDLLESLAGRTISGSGAVPAIDGGRLNGSRSLFYGIGPAPARAGLRFGRAGLPPCVPGGIVYFSVEEGGALKDGAVYVEGAPAPIFKNWALIEAFKPEGCDPDSCFGLDALDIITLEPPRVFFSVEERFWSVKLTRWINAGDLLTNTGKVITNAALMSAFGPPPLPGKIDYGLDAVNVHDDTFTISMFESLPDVTSSSVNFEILFSFEEDLALEGTDKFVAGAGECAGDEVREEDLLSTKGYVFSPGRYMTAAAREDIGWESFGFDAVDTPNWLLPSFDEEGEAGPVLPGWPYEVLFSTEIGEYDGGVWRFYDDDVLSDAPGPVVSDIGMLTAALPGGPFEGVGLDAIDVLPQGVSGLESEGEASARGRFSLAQNHPNPFSTATEIRYELGTGCHVRLEIYDTLGRKVATLIDGFETAGSKAVRWDLRGRPAGDIPSGVYFCKLRAGDFTATEKIVVLK